MTILSDDDLTRLLAEVASTYDVPDRGSEAVLAALTSTPVQHSVLRRRWLPLSAAAVVVLGGVVFAAGLHAGRTGVPTSATTRADRALSYGKYGPTAAGPQALARSATSAGADRALSGGRLADNLRAPVPAALTPAAGTTGSGSAPVAVPGAVAPPVAAAPTDGGDSRVVKSGSIALVVKDKQVSPTLTAVQSAAKDQGGYIAASSSDEYGDAPSGEVTIRVPVDRFEYLVAAVRRLNAKVRTASMTGRDVTAEYSGLESQLRTLSATRERFLVILSQTRTIGEILTVQQRVDAVSGEIDRIEGQRKLLASQSDLSTLTVSVSEAGDPTVTATSRPRSGLSQAFEDAKNGFVSGVETIVRHSGSFLLVVICLAAAYLMGRLGWRVARRRMV
ncbi:MAG: hypothetical protein NVS3B26_18610 [Mycobacteriales bacterium]